MNDGSSSTSHLPLFRPPVSGTSSKVASRYSTPASGPSSRIKAESPMYDKRERHEYRRPSDDRSIHAAPALQRQREASNLELFFDLFVSANLTVFTNVHEVRDGDTLKQYVGFFCILWFTWYQVGLYDVRFSADSIFERAAKAIQFLVMIGFAVVGPKYSVGGEAAAESAAGGEEDPEAPTLEWYFKALTLFLMVSRLVLVLQYLQSMWLTRQHKQTILPMSLITATYFAASMIYLGLFWTFHTTADENHTYVIWYVVAILETIIATTISSIWRNISFKGTHLVQRMSLLTLIILGEGVIALASKSQRIVQSEGALRFTASTIANIVCAVLVLYFIYMIYFDGLEEDHFGTIMQQIWSILHFPLHVALVLAVEGLAQCVTWRAAVVRGNKFTKQYGTWTTGLTEEFYEEIATQVNETSQYLIYRGLLTSSTLAETLEMLRVDLSNAVNASNIISTGSEHPELARDALYWIYFTLYKTIFNIAGFDSPVQRSSLRAAMADSPSSEEDDAPVDFGSTSTFSKAIQSTSTTAGVFNLTYVYFFTSVGLVVILCMAISGMSNRRKSRFEWIKLALGSLIGLALCLLSVADLTMGGTAFVFSPWLLPTVTIGLFAVVVLQMLKEEWWKYTFRASSRRGSGDSESTKVGAAQNEDELELVERIANDHEQRTR
ncbi:Putative Low temperature requirement A [Septoria linicola]|uniref:Low temperature requirement A n=1 Tax=Septoria linicola TaxID=215465 RepID=A0A9Q9AIC5_9PEZI|nr:putative Low temperature requirement A [Septoria linicola]USW47468.1 Putative Low temperature requirement A [Septoria linicola]